MCQLATFGYTDLGFSVFSLSSKANSTVLHAKTVNDPHYSQLV